MESDKNHLVMWTDVPRLEDGSVGCCDTGTSGRRRSDGNIVLVRILDSHEGDGTYAVFAGVQLLYKNKTPYDSPSKIAHR